MTPVSIPTNASLLLGQKDLCIGDSAVGNAQRWMGGYEGGLLNYGEQDIIAQANFTEAVFDWLDEEQKVHPTHLKQSLVEFNIILGMYYSGLTHQIIDLPFEPPDGLLDVLQKKL